ncbi:MAG: radical SAM protein [Thermoplasmata archaeon]|nr:radical SAM protein [Thermoplasmata archaeon]
MIVFGPVPSRRLGKSLGINNIPVKICSYACVYCQLGRTIKMSIERKAYYEPEKIFEEAKKKAGDADYITFVPDGEPTLDINLGKEIELLKEIKRIAVLTNASLLWMEDVRNDLMEASLASLKIDAISHTLWKKIDRPHPKLDLQEIIEGMLKFSRGFKGEIITETMLIDGIDYSMEFEKIAGVIKKIKPSIAYLAVPTRPPAERWVKAASEEMLVKAYHAISKVARVEYLIGYEGNEFASHENFRDDILSITNVHPMRRDAVEKLLEKHGKDWSEIEEMIKKGELIEIEYGGNKFYMRRIKSRNNL